MTRAAGICLGIIVIPLVLTLGAHAAVQAQGCGQTLTGSVTLTADLTCPTSHGLVLGNNATLNCSGHTLKGSDQHGHRRKTRSLSGRPRTRTPPAPGGRTGHVSDPARIQRVRV